MPARYPLRVIPGLVNEALADIAPVWGGVFADRLAVDRAGEAVAYAAVATIPRHPLGAAGDGATRLRPVVPLVRRAWHRRSGVGRIAFSKNRERLLDGEIAPRFMWAILARPRVKPLLPAEHLRPGYRT